MAKETKTPPATLKGVKFEVEGQIPGYLEDGTNILILKSEGKHHSCLLIVEEPDYLLGLLAKENNVKIGEAVNG